MQDALHHFLGLIFALLFCWIGCRMAHNPAKAFRLLSFGQTTEVRLFVGFPKVVGWCFAVLFGLGAIMYLVLIPVDLLRSH